jgi:hypothetical protein
LAIIGVVLYCTIVFHKHLNGETKKKEPGMEHDAIIGVVLYGTRFGSSAAAISAAIPAAKSWPFI